MEQNTRREFDVCILHLLQEWPVKDIQPAKLGETFRDLF